MLSFKYEKNMLHAIIKLWLGIRSNHKLSEVVLKEIFSSVKMKSKDSK